jgi:aminoglycoside phosphotransferase (APT) family kinase protein
VTSVERLSRGVSRETWSFVVETANESPRRLVLRRDLPGGSIDASSLHQEYEVYRRLQGSVVPVVPVLEYDDDPHRCPQGRPAYLREHVDGHWLPDRYDDPDPVWDEQRLVVCRGHTEALARVHQLDWHALGFDDVLPVPVTPATSALDMIDRHEAYLRDAEFVPHPLVTLGIHHLRRTAPYAEHICLLKGTNGLGEEVFDGTRLIAMSDWELAAIGDPAYDIAQIQGFADRIERNGEVIWSLNHALDYYAELTGWTVDPTSVRWYRNLYGLIMFAFAHRAARALADGRGREARLAWVAVEMQHHAQTRLAAAAGMRHRDSNPESQ